MAPLVFPFACLGCSVGFLQLQRLIEHVNGHRGGPSADLWAEVLMQTGPDALDASWAACGLLVPNTAHGRGKHLDACDACSEEVAGAVRPSRAATTPPSARWADSPCSHSEPPWPTRT